MTGRSAPPAGPPRYRRPPGKVSTRSWTVEDAVDGGFFLVGALLVFWLGGLLLTRGLTLSPSALGYLVLFWLLVAYVGLPRLQEVLARIYVPDYFIGRTLVGDGILGDPVNLALDGTEADLHAALTRAGWTRADEVTLRSGWGIVVSTVLRRSYPSAPVSPLFLFGRRQAFAYEQEVDGNAAQRHHVRFWPVPDGWVLPGGRRVGWLAAATYDRAVGLSLFTLQVTHKVDADIDVERDYVVDTLRYADPSVTVDVLVGFSAAFHTRNGGGDVVHTDGDLPVVRLSGTAPDPGPAVPTPGPSTPSSARLPPPALLLSGVISLAKALGTAIGLLALVADGDGAPSGHRAVTLVAMGAGAVLVAACWPLVLRHHPWARTLLMAVCAAEAVTALSALSAAGRLPLLAVATTGASVLVLIAVSSTASRRWVHLPRRSA